MTSEHIEAGKLRKRLKRSPFQGDVAIILRGSVTKCNITLFHKSQDSTSCLSALEISYQTVFLPRYIEFIAANTPERSVVVVFDPFTFNGLHIFCFIKTNRLTFFQCDEINDHIELWHFRLIPFMILFIKKISIK